jgi:hypothetical protein
LNAALDHLVVAAATLDEGVAWCRATLGEAPGPGGEHPLFGTHNRLLRLQGADAAYLEIIAIHPTAPPTRQAPLKRWFDLDDPALQARLRSQGPQLFHWVARVPDIDAARSAWLGLGIDPGPVLSASRETPQGLLQWRITVPDDGRRGFEGALPTLIQWNGPHPTATMAVAGPRLHRLSLSHPQAGRLQQALVAIGLEGIAVREGAPALHAELFLGTRPVHLRSYP